MGDGAVVFYHRVSRLLSWSPRPGVEEALRSIDPFAPGLYLVELPTGYGKSAVFYSLALEMLSGSYGGGALYAAPLRSLGSDMYRRWLVYAGAVGLDRGLAEKVSGLQQMGEPGSPFLNKPVVYTTFDTLFMHIHKIPPPEIRGIARGLTLGHAEVSRGRLADSLVFLDEPHLSISDEAAAASLINTIRYLAAAGATLILSTATMPAAFREAVVKAYLGMVDGHGVCRVIGLRGGGGDDIEGCERVDAEDEAFLEEIREREAGYRFLREETLLEEIKRLCGTARIGVVANTRKRTVELYRRIRGVCRPAYLLHSLIAADERRRIEEEAAHLSRRKESFILVSTQVIEAGFDISFDKLYTDPCPAPSLVQRAGRAGRWRGERGTVIIIEDGDPGPYPRDIVEKTISLLRAGRYSLKNPYSVGGNRGYMELIEKSMAEALEETIYRVMKAGMGKLAELMASPDTGIYSLLDSFVRGELIRSSRIAAVEVEGDGTIPVSLYLYTRLLEEGRITVKPDPSILEECFRRDKPEERYKCIAWHLLLGDVRTVMPRSVYEELAWGGAM